MLNQNQTHFMIISNQIQIQEITMNSQKQIHEMTMSNQNQIPDMIMNSQKRIHEMTMKNQIDMVKFSCQLQKNSLLKDIKID